MRREYFTKRSVGREDASVSLLTDRTNKVQIGSIIYSTLHDVVVDYWGISCGNTWAVMPSDWVFAPDDSASRSVAASYTWYTMCVVFAGGGSEFSRYARSYPSNKYVGGVGGGKGDCGSRPPYSQNENEYRSNCDNWYTQLLILQ